MAKIPKYEQGQRLNPQGPQQAYDTGAARMEGENIQAVGKQLQNFANAMDDYNKIKKRTDDAIFAKMVKDEADVVSQDAERRIRSNIDGKTAPDGSNMVELYDSSFTELYDKYSGVEDPRRRQIAKNAIGLARNVYRGQISDASVATHNAWMFQETMNSNKKMGAIIANDPNQFAKKLTEQKTYLATLPLGTENKMKLIKDAEDTAALGLISHYQEKGDYKTAEQMIKGPLAEFFSVKDRKDLLDDNEKEFRQAKNEEWTDRERNRTLKREKREDERIKAIDEILPHINSDDPIARDEAVAKAKLALQNNQITQQDYELMKKTDFEADYSKSDEIAYTYTARLEKRQGMDTYIDDVMKDRNISPKEKQSLIAAYSDQRNKRKSDPLDTFERGRASEFINKTFDPERVEKALGDKVGYGYVAKAQKQFIINMRNGMSPMQAAVSAIKKIDPTNSVLGSYGTKETVSEDQITREEYEIKQQIQFKKERGTLLEKDIDKASKRMIELRRQRLYLKNKSAVDRAVKDEDGK